jgi:hypothetical protein
LALNNNCSLIIDVLCFQGWQGESLEIKQQMSFSHRFNIIKHQQLRQTTDILVH